MKNELTHYILLLKRIGLSLFIFAFCRLVFLTANFGAFSNYPASTLALAFIYGLRFDISTSFYLNAFFYLLHILPLNIRNRNWYQVILWIIFVIMHGLALMFEFGDTAYFKFSHKRLTIDFFDVLGDFKDQSVSYLYTFWPFVLLFIAVIYFIARIYPAWAWIKPGRKQNFWIQLLLMIPATALFILGARGGYQYKPITPITALEYGDANFSPLLFSTSFSIGSSYQMKGLEEKEYFTDRMMFDSIFNQRRFYYADSLPVKRKNVVVIILEGFSRNFVGALTGEKTYTPFLDSLINSGECYSALNGYANARHSHEGNAAILASIPSLMVDPFMTSLYQSNKVTSFASMLKAHGYATSFFHGANNGSMTLDLFTRSCGFDNYYGRNEYPDPSDYDGNWGIYDHKFLSFFASKLDNTTQPFASAIFTLSSHFPYNMPAEFKAKFPPEAGLDPMYPMVRYTDYSLRLFFDEVKKMKFYGNTLFVICADHTFGELRKEDTYLTKFSIPIIFFDPSDISKKKPVSFPVQQTDILPSIMHYLNLPDTFNCFGNSVFDLNGDHFAINHEQGFYQLVEDDCLLQFDGTKAIGFFDLKVDPRQTDNKIKSDDPRIHKLTLKIEAIIQTFNEAMIKNRL
jgi:phosphoglycerol transferase MdoB-like AlkP superfamily enzyme